MGADPKKSTGKTERKPRWLYSDGVYSVEVEAGTRSEARAAVKAHFAWKSLPKFFTLKRTP
jgi:hypothetical protein